MVFLLIRTIWPIFLFSQVVRHYLENAGSMRIHFLNTQFQGL